MEQRRLAQSMRANYSRIHNNTVDAWRSNYPTTTPAFIIDLGATHHLAGSRQVFDRVGFRRVVESLLVGNAFRMEIVGMGSVSHGSINLPDVRYVPALGSMNFVSVSQLTAMDYKVEFNQHGFLVKESLGEEEIVVGRGTRDVNQALYMVESLRIPLDRGRLPDYRTFQAAMNRQ